MNTHLHTPYKEEVIPVYVPSPSPSSAFSKVAVLAALIAGLFIGFVPLRVHVPDPPPHVAQEADIKALIAAYNNLASILPQAKTAESRKAIYKEGTVYLAKIRTLLDTMPTDKIPPEALRFQLVR